MSSNPALEQLVPDRVHDDRYITWWDRVHTDALTALETDSIIAEGELQPGMRVLDAPCGTGRIARRLAEKGFVVLGVDKSRRCIRLARERCNGTGDVTFRTGDMRRLDIDGEFDAVVNWGVSFGYFDDETDAAILTRFRRALKPGGRLILQCLSRDWVTASLLARPPRTAPVVNLVTEVDGDLLVDSIGFDALSGRAPIVRHLVMSGRHTRYSFALRLYAPSELAERLQRAGFEEIRFLHARTDDVRHEYGDMRVLAIA